MIKASLKTMMPVIVAPMFITPAPLAAVKSVSVKGEEKISLSSFAKNS